LRAQAVSNLVTADKDETEHVCKQVTILPTQIQLAYNSQDGLLTDMTLPFSATCISGQVKDCT